VTRGIDALAEQGLVIRREDPEDRRRTILSLSAKGKRIHDKVEEVSRALEQELLRVRAPPSAKRLIACSTSLSAGRARSSRAATPGATLCAHRRRMRGVAAAMVQ
jgi:DNA-binding MarR family transcriptional regulator